MLAFVLRHRRATAYGLVATAALVFVACGHPARQRPTEIPIAEYKPAAVALPGDAGASKPEAPTVASAAVEPIGGLKDDAPAVAAKLDAKNGFGGASFGDSKKTVRGIKESGRRGDHVTYRATTSSYAGVLIKDLSYTFAKNKLALIGFGLKSLGDCKTVKDGLERELGTPQTSVRETQVWRGEKVGLRFAVGTGGCSAIVVSKELGNAADWASIEP